MKIMLAGHEGCYNRGCEAIIRSTLFMLDQKIPGLDVTLSSFHHKDDATVDFQRPMSVVPANSNKPWTKFTREWFLSKIYWRINQDLVWDMVLGPVIKNIQAMDAVLSVGGDNYTDDYIQYGDPLLYYIHLNKIVKRHNKKLIIWGASIGPFKKRDRIDFIVDSLAAADLITVREKISFDYLDDLGLKNIKQVADPAFLLQPSQVPMPEETQDGKMLIGFNVSPLLGDYLGEDGNSVVVRESIRFIEEAVKQYQATILLIPHVVDVGSANNDHEFMKKIYEGTRHTRQVKLLEPDYSANELKFIISSCDYFIGARTHATIAALSSGIPTICIGYSQKSVGINMDLFQTLDYLIDIKNYSADALLKKFGLLCEKEQEIKNTLELTLPQVRALSWANVGYLQEVLY